MNKKTLFSLFCIPFIFMGILFSSILVHEYVHIFQLDNPQELVISLSHKLPYTAYVSSVKEFSKKEDREMENQAYIIQHVFLFSLVILVGWKLIKV